MPEAPSIEQICKLPFFFILGRPRSGTTLLRTVLDAHPSINIPLENPGMIHLYFRYRKVKTWNTKMLNSFYTDFINEFNIKNWHLNEERIKRAFIEISEFTNKSISFPEIIRIFYFYYQSEFNKETILYLGDKSPLNSLYAKEIAMIFPNAKFIHLVRDYRANLASMSKQAFFSPSSTVILMQWKKSVSQISRLTVQYPHRFLQMRYEDFVADPEMNYKLICNFLQLKYMPELLDAEYRNKVVNKLYSSEFIDKWQPNLSKEISTSNIDKWKNELSTGIIKKADYIAGRKGLEFGYYPTTNSFDLFFILKTRSKELLFHLNEMNRYIFDRLPYRLKQKIKNRKFILSYTLIRLYKKLFIGKQ